MLLEKLDPFSSNSLELKEEDLNSICYFDTETTGLSPRNSQIVEIAAIKDSQTFYRKILLTEETQIEIEHQKQNPTHGKSIEDLLNMSSYYSSPPTTTEIKALLEFKQFIQGSSFLLAHNASFDMKMINERLKKYSEPPLEKIPVWDSLAFSRRFLVPALITMEETSQNETEKKKAKDILDVLTSTYWPKSGKRKKISSKLGDLSTALKGKIEGWHEALADVKTLKTLVEEFFLTYQKITSSLSSSPTFKKFYMKNRNQEQRMKEWGHKKIKKNILKI